MENLLRRLGGSSLGVDVNSFLNKVEGCRPREAGGSPLGATLLICPCNGGRCVVAHSGELVLLRRGDRSTVGKVQKRTYCPRGIRLE